MACAGRNGLACSGANGDECRVPSVPGALAPVTGLYADATTPPMTVYWDTTVSYPNEIMRLIGRPLDGSAPSVIFSAPRDDGNFNPSTLVIQATLEYAIRARPEDLVTGEHGDWVAALPFYVDTPAVIVSSVNVENTSRIRVAYDHPMIASAGVHEAFIVTVDAAMVDVLSVTVDPADQFKVDIIIDHVCVVGEVVSWIYDPTYPVESLISITGIEADGDNHVASNLLDYNAFVTDGDNFITSDGLTFKVK